jgi:hypothetical protein
MREYLRLAERDTIRAPGNRGLLVDGRIAGCGLDARESKMTGARDQIADERLASALRRVPSTMPASQRRSRHRLAPAHRPVPFETACRCLAGCCSGSPSTAAQPCCRCRAASAAWLPIGAILLLWMIYFTDMMCRRRK